MLLTSIVHQNPWSFQNKKEGSDHSVPSSSSLVLHPQCT